MFLWQKYHIAVNTTDALQALAGAAGPARLVAGGTDLLLDLQQGRCPPVHTLVDVTRCAELTCLEVRGERLFIGAAIPLSQLVASPLVQEHAWALWEACGLIAGPQVRNTATLGGNVAHALPAGDGSIALLALRAQAEIASLSGSRTAPLESLFLGPGRSALLPGQELLVGFYIPLKAPGQTSAFKRLMRPQGVALPILNMAAWLHRDGETLADLALAIGPAGGGTLPRQGSGKNADREASDRIRAPGGQPNPPRKRAFPHQPSPCFFSLPPAPGHLAPAPNVGGSYISQ